MLRSSLYTLPLFALVEIYVTSWCPYCRLLEKFLNARGVQYKRYDVEHDPEGIRRYQSMGAGGVPITKIDGTIIRGFSSEVLSRLLRVNPSDEDTSSPQHS